MNTTATPDFNGAIERLNRPLLIGKIAAWEELFVDIGYQASTSVKGEREYFPLISKVEGLVWGDIKNNTVLHAKPTPALLSMVRKSIGYKQRTNPMDMPFGSRQEFTDVDAFGAFSIIQWDEFGVALVSLNKTDHSSGYYVGFIDLAHIPTFSPEIEVKAAGQASPNHLPTSPSIHDNGMRP